MSKPNQANARTEQQRGILHSKGLPGSAITKLENHIGIDSAVEATDLVLRLVASFRVATNSSDHPPDNHARIFVRRLFVGISYDQAKPDYPDTWEKLQTFLEQSGINFPAVRTNGLMVEQFYAAVLIILTDCEAEIATLIRQLVRR